MMTNTEADACFYFLLSCLNVHLLICLRHTVTSNWFIANTKRTGRDKYPFLSVLFYCTHCFNKAWNYFGRFVILLSYLFIFYLHNSDPKSLFLHLKLFKHETIFFCSFGHSVSNFNWRSFFPGRMMHGSCSCWRDQQRKASWQASWPGSSSGCGRTEEFRPASVAPESTSSTTPQHSESVTPTNVENNERLYSF